VTVEAGADGGGLVAGEEVELENDCASSFPLNEVGEKSGERENDLELFRGDEGSCPASNPSTS
jgi:hypothetical protein